MTSERIAYTQSGRMMAVETPLGEDVLLLTHLEIDERVNELFSIQAAVKAHIEGSAKGGVEGLGSKAEIKGGIEGTMTNTPSTPWSPAGDAPGAELH